MTPFLWVAEAICPPELHRRPPKLRVSCYPAVNQCNLRGSMPQHTDGRPVLCHNQCRAHHSPLLAPQRVLKEDLSRTAAAPQPADFIKRRGEVTLFFLIPRGVELKLQPASIFRGLLGKRMFLSGDTMTVAHTLPFPWRPCQSPWMLALWIGLAGVQGGM